MVFGDPEFFGVPAGLLVGPSVFDLFDRCKGVGAVRDPGVDLPESVVEFAGGFGLLGGEYIYPFCF